jgi:hypothetical protein
VDPSSNLNLIGNFAILKVLLLTGARDSLVVKALCYKPEVTGSIPDEMIFLIYLILPATLGSGVYSASNRNEYQKHKNNNVSVE